MKRDRRTESPEPPTTQPQQNILLSSMESNDIPFPAWKKAKTEQNTDLFYDWLIRPTPWQFDIFWRRKNDFGEENPGPSRSNAADQGRRRPAPFISRTAENYGRKPKRETQLLTNVFQIHPVLAKLGCVSTLNYVITGDRYFECIAFDSMILTKVITFFLILRNDLSILFLYNKC